MLKKAHQHPTLTRTIDTNHPYSQRQKERQNMAAQIEESMLVLKDRLDSQAHWLQQSEAFSDLDTSQISDDKEQKTDKKKEQSLKNRVAELEEQLCNPAKLLARLLGSEA